MLCVINDSVAPGNADVIDTHLGVMATAHPELDLVTREGEHVHGARRVAF